jgi:LacI family transcriptional regulator/LacI family repressor for deo operon, udp, cdd, tsx, nupC, and nupG
VASSTVSRALRDSPLISADVRAHIQRLAREMGYTPNGIAQSLQTRRTDTIGLVVTSIADPFFADVANGVEEVARPADLSVFLSSSHNDPAQEEAVIDLLHRRRVDGILVASSRMGEQALGQLTRLQVPIILINSNAEAHVDRLHSVAVDDVLGARLAVDHLLQLGHRAIGYIGGANRPRAHRRRLEGYRSTLAAAGYAPPESWQMLAPGDDPAYTDDVAAGQALVRPLLEAGVTAVFCFNDMVATGVLLACRELGLAVPGDLSIVGYDDIALTRYLTPPLTTVHQPKLELGRAAMTMMLDLLGQRPVEDRVLQPTLLSRGSTAAPRARSTKQLS